MLKAFLRYKALSSFGRMHDVDDVTPSLPFVMPPSKRTCVTVNDDNALYLKNAFSILLSIFFFLQLSYNFSKFIKAFDFSSVEFFSLASLTVQSLFFLSSILRLRHSISPISTQDDPYDYALMFEESCL